MRRGVAKSTMDVINLIRSEHGSTEVFWDTLSQQAAVDTLILFQAQNELRTLDIERYLDFLSEPSEVVSSARRMMEVLEDNRNIDSTSEVEREKLLKAVKSILDENEGQHSQERYKHILRGVRLKVRSGILFPSY